MDTEGRQGNIVVTKKLKLEEKNIVSVKDNKERRNIITEKHIAKIVRDNEELENTINNITMKNDGKDSDIINMLNDMIQEGRERIEKLLITHRAAVAPTSRTEPTSISRAELPIKHASGGHTAPEPLTPRVMGGKGWCTRS